MWRNTSTGEIFQYVLQLPELVRMTPAGLDEEGYPVIVDGVVWQNTVTGTKFIRHNGEWRRCVEYVPPGPYERT
jgi:hypothetical protein